MGCPSRIYNMDESGMPLDHKPPKVVTRKGTKKVHCRTSGNKAQITVLACANAAGSVIPPMVIFEGQRLNPEWSKGEVPDTLYGMSEKGWTDQELFYYWLTELFVKQIPPARPVMLLVDGHSSHYEPESIRAAAEQGIIVFCLPPHSTHVAQPLDVSFFHPLKVYWSEACHTFMQENPGCVVTKYQFSRLFSKAWYKAIQPQNLISGFTKTGIHPFNPNAISILPCPPGVDDNSEDESDSDEDMKLDDDNGGSINGDGGTPNPGDNPSNSKSISFSPQQIELFTTRYENGYDIYTDADYVTWLAGYHPDALPDYVNPDDSALQQRSDPFQPFEDYNQVGDRQNDGEVHHLGDNLKHSVGDMETGNNGTPNSDDYKSDDKALGEGNMETDSNGAPRPDDSKSDDKALGEGNMETESSEAPRSDDLKSDDKALGEGNMETESSEAPRPDNSKSEGKASGEGNVETESNGTPRPDDSKFDNNILQSTTPIQEKEHNPESITKVLTPSSTSSLSTTAGTSNRSSSGGSASVSTRKPLSSLSEFLTFPKISHTPKSSKQKKSNGPRVLTSATAIALMEEKQRKKKEEEEAKEQRKREREAKKLQKEEEKKQKAEEKQKREEERKKKAEERELEKKRKAELRKVERRRKAEEKERRQAEKENCPVRNKKKHHRESRDGLQQGEISNNECATCFGLYEDDLVDGELCREWIRCTNNDCGKWMHIECLATADDQLYVCRVCNNTFA